MKQKGLAASGGQAFSNFYFYSSGLLIILRHPSLLKLEAAALQQSDDFGLGRIEFRGRTEKVIGIDRVPVAAGGIAEASDIDGPNGLLDFAGEYLGFVLRERLASVFEQAAADRAEVRMIAQKEG